MDTSIYEQKFAAAVAHFAEDIKKIRTGRAHPDMLDGVVVEVYGSKMPLNQVASVSAPESQQILVTPFDPGNVAAISAASAPFAPSPGFAGVLIVVGFAAVMAFIVGGRAVRIVCFIVGIRFGG